MRNIGRFASKWRGLGVLAIILIGACIVLFFVWGRSPQVSKVKKECDVECKTCEVCPTCEYEVETPKCEVCPTKNYGEENRISNTIPLHDLQHDILEFQAYLVNGKRIFVNSPVMYEWVTKYEKKVIELAKRINCENGGLVLDVGMNDGFYTLLSAAKGCKVHSFEIQTGCIEKVHAALNLNGLVENVEVHNHPVSNGAEELELIVSGKGCGGTYSLFRPGTANTKPFGPDDETRIFTTVSLDDFFPDVEEIRWLKVDTEGAEPRVLEGAKTLFENNIVEILSVEAIPDYWDKPYERSYLQPYIDLFSYGYSAKCVWMRNRIDKKGPLHQTLEWNSENIDDFVHLNRLDGNCWCVDLIYYLPSARDIVLNL